MPNLQVIVLSEIARSFEKLSHEQLFSDFHD